MAQPQEKIVIVFPIVRKWMYGIERVDVALIRQKRLPYYEECEHLQEIREKYDQHYRTTGEKPKG